MKHPQRQLEATVLCDLGQSSKSARAKLIGLKNFKDFDDEEDTTTLLIEIKAIIYEYKGNRNH